MHVHIFVNIAIVLLGLLVVALEARATLCGVNIVRVITAECRLLSRVWGRGLFYMFLATLALSKVRCREEDVVYCVLGCHRCVRVCVLFIHQLTLPAAVKIIFRNVV